MPTVDDVRTLADTMSPKFGVMVLLSACGLRHGEVAELHRKDLSDDPAVLTVARAMTYRSGQTVIGLPKSVKARTVVVLPHIRDDLNHHLDVHVGARVTMRCFSRVSAAST